MKKIFFILSLFLVPFISHGAFVQATSTIQVNGVGPTSTIAMTNLTVGNTVLISCSASAGGSNWQATSGNHIYVSSTQPSDNLVLDRFQSGSTFLGQWTWRATVHNATTTYYCYNSQGFLGFVYMSLSEFSDVLTVVSSTSKSSVSQTSDAGVLDSGSVGDLAYMVHMQDFFSTQSPTVTDNAFVSSTDIEYSGQSRQIVYYDYRASTGQVTTTVSGWNYNDQYIANAVRYSVSGVTPTSPVVSLLFPTGATTTPDFSNWVLSVSYPSSTMTYVGVLYGQDDTNLIYSDNATYASGVSANPLAVRKTEALWHIPQSVPQTWFYRTFYIQNGTLYSSATSSFLISPSAPVPVLSSSTSALVGFGLSAGTYVPTAHTSCVAPTSSIFTAPGDNLAYGICASGQFLFSPSNFSQNWIDGAVNGAKTVFPFRVIFGVATALQNEINNSSTNRTAQSYDLVLHTSVGGQDMTYPVLTSSTLTNAVGSSTKALVFDVEEKFIWLLFILGLVKIIL